MVVFVVKYGTRMMLWNFLSKQKPTDWTENEPRRRKISGTVDNDNMLPCCQLDNMSKAQIVLFSGTMSWEYKATLNYY